jgi:hypothetical protein
MLKNNIYNIDKEFDYSAVKAIVVKSLEKILKQESLRDVSTISTISYQILRRMVTICLPHLHLY